MDGSLAAGIVAMSLSIVSLSGQEAVLKKGEPLTLRGEVIEISCYQKKGAAEGTGSAHVACAKECAKAGKALGILSDGDGLFKIVGSYANQNGAKLIPFLGETVEATGAEVLISNNYVVKSFDIQKIVVVKNKAR